MVLIGNSVHCLCVMICLQVWKQWQFGIGVRCNEDTKQLLFVGIIVHWFPIFSLEDKGSWEGRSCYEEMGTMEAEAPDDERMHVEN